MVDFKSKLGLDYLSTNRFRTKPSLEAALSGAREGSRPSLLASRRALAEVVRAGEAGVRIHDLVDTLERPIAEVRPLVEYLCHSGYVSIDEPDPMKGNDHLRATEKALGGKGHLV